MTTNKTQLGIRFTQERYDYIKQLENELGISKNAVVEMLVDFHRSHTQSVSTFGKASAGEVSGVSKVLAPSKSVSTLKGIDADEAILTGIVKHIETTDILWFDGYVWLMGKTPNGSQNLVKKQFEYPEILFAAIGTRATPTFKQVKVALARYQEFWAIDGIHEVIALMKQYRAYSLSRFFNDDKYDGYPDMRNDALRLVSEHKEKLALEAIAEATAVIEPTNEEIAIEVAEEPLCPYIEPIEPTTPLVTQLTSVEFRDRFGLLDDGSYSIAVQAGRKSGYKANDGSMWGISGNKKKAIWSLQLVRQLELAIA